MPSRVLALALLAGLALPAAALAVTPEAIDEADLSSKPEKGVSAAVVRAQILLDRAGFSPGIIDGRSGENVDKAVKAFEAARGLPADGTLDEAVWAALAADAPASLLTDYTLTDADVRGPFTADIPGRMEAMKGLERLAYRGPEEALAERFHMSEDLLASLNPKADLRQAGTTIRVAHVDRERPKAKAARIEVDKSERTVRVFSKDGALLAFYPASIGSDEKPAPDGAFKVTAVARNPTYRYNPDFKFKGVKADEAFTIAPGPNNPVGAVWIDLSAETYGIHGTPEPAKVSKTESHGCVRLTNWDALALADMVEKGTAVEFKD